MQPIQVLNGYDKPWAGGTGKNLAPITLTETTGWNGRSYTIVKDASGNSIGVQSAGTATNTGNVYYVCCQMTLDVGTYILTGAPTGKNLRLGQGTTGTGTFVGNDEGNGLRFTVSEAANYIVAIRQAPSETEDLLYQPMIRLASDTDASFAPYENKCPIYGSVSATAHIAGKNLAPTFVGGTVAGVTFTVGTGGLLPNGAVQVSGTPTGNATLYTSVFYLPAGTYTVSGAPAGSSNGTLDMLVADVSGTATTIARAFDGSTQDTFTLTQLTPIRYGIRCRSVASTTSYDAVFYPMIRIASDTDDTYAPYNAKTYTLSFGETVYSGSVDFVTGYLESNMGEIASYSGEEINEPWLSSLDEYVEGTSPTNGAQVVYTLASPTTTQLTGQEITTYLGKNNIWVTTTTNQ